MPLQNIISPKQSYRNPPIISLPHHFPSFLFLPSFTVVFSLVPRVAPTDFALKPDSSGTGLIATWKAPDPAKVNGRIIYYVIKYRKVGTTEESTTERIGVSGNLLSRKFGLLLKPDIHRTGKSGCWWVDWQYAQSPIWSTRDCPFSSHFPAPLLRIARLNLP